MKIVFCGSGVFGIPTLRWLCRSNHKVVAVVTQPARRAGRGGKRRATPLSEAAEDLGLTVTAMADINAPDSVAALAACQADAIVVVDFGQMIRSEARQAARLEAYNLHGSLLPALRGAAPVNWAIIRGLDVTGVTTFRLVDRMDAGEVFSQRRCEIQSEETVEDLRARLAELGTESVAETLEGLAAGRLAGEPQDDALATKAPRLSKADGRIDFTADAVTVRNLIHGTWPWPGGRAHYVGPAGREVDVTIARARMAAAEARVGEPGVFLPDGTVATGRGTLEILELKPAGRRLMALRDFANGHHVGPGARLMPVTP